MAKLNKYPHISLTDLEVIISQVICELYTYYDYPYNPFINKENIKASKEANEDVTEVGDFSDFIIEKCIENPSEYKKLLSLDVNINRVYIYLCSFHLNPFSI